METQQSNASSDTHKSAPAAGLFAGLAGMAKNIFGLLFSRMELAALELAEVRTAILKLSLFFALGVVAAWFALAYWSALIVVLSWDSLGWKILLILAVAFTIAAMAIVWYVRSIINQGQIAMPATMAELRNDRDALL